MFAGFGQASAVRARLALNRGIRSARLPRSELVEAVVAHITSAKKPHLTAQSDIAKQRFINPAHLGRRVYDETGLHFWQWRAAASMRQAARDLAGEPRSMSELAWDLGFSRLSGFDREFEQTFQISPTMFRHLCRALGVVASDAR